MGDSAKAPMYDHRFVDHANHLDQWFDSVGATRNVHLVIHDWGSALGFYRAKRFPEQIASITYLEALVRPRPWSGFGEAEGNFKALRTARGEELSGSVIINDRPVSTVNTRGLQWGLGEMLAHASRDEHMLPGEVVATGTLTGGSGIETGNWLRRGDTLKLVLDGIGDVEHRILET